MALSNVARRLTAAELAREPRNCGVFAYFDAYGQAAWGARPWEYPRRITPDEAASWREGWAEGAQERRCHNAHGFLPCTPDTHPNPATSAPGTATWKDFR